MGVSNENMGFSNEIVVVTNENMEVSNEIMGFQGIYGVSIEKMGDSN